MKLKQMKEIAEYKKYQVITIPDIHGVNCLYLNNTLVHCSRDELFNSAKVNHNLSNFKILEDFFSNLF